MKVMFLDESGDHQLKKINQAYPIFVLGGVIVERSCLRRTIEPRVREFKRLIWGHENVTLHTVDIRNNAGDFRFLIDPLRRSVFFDALNALLAEMEYKVIAVVIDKNAYLAQYGADAADLYHYAFELLLDRFCRELEDDPDGGFICAEKRGEGLDRALLQAWVAFRERGVPSCGVPWEAIESHIIGLDLRNKRPHLAGMQIADLVITPPGRHVRNAPEKNRPSALARRRTKSSKGRGSLLGRRLDCAAVVSAKKVRGRGLLHSTPASYGTATQCPSESDFRGMSLPRQALLDSKTTPAETMICSCFTDRAR